MHAQSYLSSFSFPPQKHPFHILVHQHKKQLEMRANAISRGIFWSVLILSLTSCLHQQLRLFKVGAADMVPLVEEAGKFEMMVMVNESRRKLGSFQICSLCTCCGGSYCLPSPCCYAINCNIPNRPFGFCSFTPKTCNCFG